MLEKIVASQAKSAGRRSWLPLTSMALALGFAVITLPALAEQTYVERKVITNNDGYTTTTTTTETTTSSPQVERVVVPGTPTTLTVERVLVPSKPLAVADQVVVPVPSTTIDEVVIPPATTTTVEKVVVPSGTTTVKKVVIDAPVYMQTLEARQARLRAFIAAGLANGSLAQAQADAFRRELDRLASLSRSFESASQLTYEQVLPLAMEYDLVTSDLKVVDIKPLIQGSQFVLSDTHVYAIDDLMRRRAGLEAKIAVNLATGKLSVSEANHLRGMLNHVAVVESDFRGDGQVSDHEARRLYDEFDRVGSAIDKAL